MLFKHTLVRFHQEEIWKKNHDSNYLDVILRYFEDLKKSVINTKIQNERDKRWRWMNFEDACKMKCEALIKSWMFFFFWWLVWVWCTFWWVKMGHEPHQHIAHCVVERPTTFRTCLRLESHQHTLTITQSFYSSVAFFVTKKTTTTVIWSGKLILNKECSGRRCEDNRLM